MMTMMKTSLMCVAFCGVAVVTTSAFVPAAPFLRDQHHVVSLNDMHRPSQLAVTTLWGSTSSSHDESESAGRVSQATVQLPKAVASFCVASLLAVSLLAGPDMAMAAATKVAAPEPTPTESVKSKKSSKKPEAAPAAAAIPAEQKAVDSAKATLTADKAKVADVMALLKKAKTENDSALAEVNKAEVAAEKAKAAYIKENDRLVSLPTSATVNSIVAEKDKVGMSRLPHEECCLLSNSGGGVVVFLILSHIFRSATLSTHLSSTQASVKRC
jgi:hypothetical protein